MRETTKKPALEEKKKYAEAAKAHKKVADDRKAAEKIFKKHAFREDTRKPLRLPLCEDLEGKSLPEEKVRDAVQAMLLRQECVLLRISDPRGPGIRTEEEEASENEAEEGGDVREEGRRTTGKNGSNFFRESTAESRSHAPITYLPQSRWATLRNGVCSDHDELPFGCRPRHCTPLPLSIPALPNQSEPLKKSELRDRNHFLHLSKTVSFAKTCRIIVSFAKTCRQTRSTRGWCCPSWRKRPLASRTAPTPSRPWETQAPESALSA